MNGLWHKWRVPVAFLLLALAFAVEGWWVDHNRKVADRHIRDAAVERVKQITASRRDVLIRACREQNSKHDKTIETLDERIAKVVPPSRRRRAERSRDFTVALIEALAPRRHCVKRADRLIR